jgi:hypothetical protein
MILMAVHHRAILGSFGRNGGARPAPPYETLWIRRETVAFFVQALEPSLFYRSVPVSPSRSGSLFRRSQSLLACRGGIVRPATPQIRLERI